jgi:hypothetical protein
MRKSVDFVCEKRVLLGEMGSCFYTLQLFTWAREFILFPYSMGNHKFDTFEGNMKEREEMI